MNDHPRNLGRAACTLLLTTLLAGCASRPDRCTGDPRYDDLYCASANLNGYYQGRTAGMRNDVIATDARARQEQASSSRSAGRAEQLRQEGDRRSGDVSAINAEIAGMEAQLSAERGQLAQLQARGAGANEIRALEADINRLRAKISRLREIRN